MAKRWSHRIHRPFIAAATVLAVGAIGLTPAAADGDPWTQSNPQTPRSEINITGAPQSGTNADGTVSGYVDAHTHLMSDIGFGGNIVCGSTFSEHGIADALQDCDTHEPDGSTALIENLTYKNRDLEPFATHDPVGWPTFTDWPNANSMTHQQMYYEWVERAWRGGERIMVADAVNNNILCSLPLQKNDYSCDDMDTVRRQIAETKALEKFVDDRFGGPGKGFFRIAYSEDEARTYVEQGKLAVILGVEVSNPFGCKVVLGVPQCTKAQIDAGLTEFHDLGVRSMFLCHKFDNALCGVHFDSGAQGVIVNLGNFLNTGQWWQTEACRNGLADHRIALGVIPKELAPYLPVSLVLPVYPAGEHCNPKGLTALGEYALDGMMKRGMLVEIDHMSVKAQLRTLDLLEAANYPGVVSSHSWMNPELYERVYRLGGFVTQYGHDADAFVEEMGDTEALRAKYDVGFGYGMDMNGFGGTPNPREGSTVTYPFTVLGGAQADRQVTGERVFDYTKDGVPHYGLIPDWIEDMRQIGGQSVVDDLARGAESYLRTAAAAQSWSRPANVARGKLAQASSNEWNPFTSYAAARAVDGRLDTRWASGWGDQEWIRVDLGSTQPVGRVVLNWEAAYGKDYRIQVSDDASTWRTVGTVVGGDGGLDVVVLDRTDARWVRVQGDRRATKYGYSLYEFQVQNS